MDEKTIMAYQIRKLTLLIAGVLIVLSLIFKEPSITGGIAIGAMVSIIGFNMVVKMAYKINGPTAGRSARANYLLRYMIYAVVFGISYWRGFNIFALLAGFLCNKAAILIYTRFFADKEVK